MLFEYLFLLICSIIQLNEASVNYCSTPNSLRIYGNNPNLGMLQICSSGYWKAVCSQSWNCIDAKVACHQLGFTGIIAYYPYSNYGYWSQKYNYYFSCSGAETKLSSCPKYPTSSSCNYYYSNNARIYCRTLYEPSGGSGILGCTNGDVRLVDGDVENALEGKVEICYEGGWQSICNIALSAASVICKQLGYSRYATIVPSSYGSSQTLISSLSCSYDYNHLNECTINTQSSICSTTSSLSSCSSSIKCYPLNYSELCLEGSVRLTGGDIVQEGQLELCHDGVWGVFSSYGWSASDSYVACKQMGYDSGIAPVVISSSTLSTIPVLFAHVSCGGYEKTLTQCSKAFYPFTNYYYYYYYYYYSIHIRCYEDCNNGDIRLVGGLVDTEGTVEICRDNLWGLVSDINWGDDETRVVCRQLGFITDDIHAVHGSFYGRPEKTMHYSHVVCNGAEDRLTQCEKTTISLSVGKTTYKAVDAAGVSCHGPPVVPTTTPPCIPPQSILSTSPVCTTGQVRLIGGQSAAEGILQYCYNGQWSHFCALQSQEATVACIQLGYTQYTRAAIFTSEQFGLNSSNYSLFQNIDCGDSDLVLSLTDCTLQTAESCLPSCLPIGIRCYVPGSCEEGAIRLMGGIIQQEGRVEVCIDGVWGSICDQNWDKTDAHLVCQEMGYPELEPVAYHNSYFGDGYGPILYSNVSCGGWEQGFTDCNKVTYSSFVCSRKQTAGVLCGEHCNDGDIRLVGGNSKYEGTIEICFGNLWGLIAEAGWGDYDAQVVCRQLEFTSDDAMSYANSYFGKPNKTIHASDITCFGDEQTLSECTMTTYELETGKALLEQVGVVGVSCTPNPCLENPVTPPCSISGSIRLVGGGASNKGKVEYCYDGSWIAACSIGLPEATVACRQLGYAEYAWATLVTSENIIKPAINSSYFVNASCSGAELDLNGCSHNRICSSVCLNNTVTCYDTTNPCDEGSIRLAGGTANKNGRIEVCYNGVWGTVCGNNWGLPDAFVVCMQLGLTNGSVAAVTTSIFGKSNLPIIYSDVTCGGWETNILGCPKKLHGEFQCSNNLAGIVCSDTCSDGDVRLVGGATDLRWRVQWRFAQDQCGE